MKRPTFFYGVAIAMVAALLGEVLFVALTPLLGSYTALQMVIAIASFGYILTLLRASGEKLGRLVTLVGWLLVTAATAWFSLHLVITLLIHTLMIWLVRALYFHASLLTAQADLGLNMVAVAAALWATLQSGSLLLALWCYFLVQALFVMIPTTLAARRTTAAVGENDHFEQARSAAQSALRKLSAIN